MRILDIVLKKGRTVETIGAFETIKSAADALREKQIAALVVIEDGSVRGIISEREIVHAMSLHGPDLFSKKIKDVMLKDMVPIRPQDSVKQSMRLMTHNRARHLPVMSDGALAGIVSIGDVVKHRLEDLELETNVLRDAYIAAH